MKTASTFTLVTVKFQSLISRGESETGLSVYI